MCQAFKLQAKTRKRFCEAHIGRGFTEKNEKKKKKKERKENKNRKKEVDTDEDLQGADTDVMLSSDSDKGNTNVSDDKGDDKDDEYFPPYPLKREDGVASVYPWWK